MHKEKKFILINILPLHKIRYLSSKHFKSSRVVVVPSSTSSSLSHLDETLSSGLVSNDDLNTEPLPVSLLVYSGMKQNKEKTPGSVLVNAKKQSHFCYLQKILKNKMTFFLSFSSGLDEPVRGGCA